MARLMLGAIINKNISLIKLWKSLKFDDCTEKKYVHPEKYTDPVDTNVVSIGSVNSAVIEANPLDSMAMLSKLIHYMFF